MALVVGDEAVSRMPMTDTSALSAVGGVWWGVAFDSGHYEFLKVA